MYDLILLRHGRSEWNELNLFTGWYDCDLTEAGRTEAIAAGSMLLDAGILPAVVHTSLQKRAIRTAQLTLDVMDRMWLPTRRSWRLNERHYGDLTGRNKAETAEKFGADKVKVWRRSYDIPPPDISDDNTFNPNDDPQYASVPPDVLPSAECLQRCRRSAASLLVRRTDTRPGGARLDRGGRTRQQSPCPREAPR